MRPTPSDINAAKAYISNNWSKTVAHADAGNPEHLKLPRPFTVPTPGGKFHEFYYWDTYYTTLGLYRQGMDAIALDDIENMLFCIEKFGCVPNIVPNRHHYQSQPPHSTLMVSDVFDRTGDKVWLDRAYELVKREYGFWMSMRMDPIGLNHYYVHANPDQIWDTYDKYRKRRFHIPQDPAARLKVLISTIAEDESGWDYTRRFDFRCDEFCPCDLNALLYMHELNCARFCEIIGNGEQAIWKHRAEIRRSLMNEHCWNEKQGVFCDQDRRNRKVSDFVSIAAYYPLWAEIATEEQAERSFRCLKTLETDYGILTCLPGKAEQPVQWDYPNAWPPLQYGAMQGFLKYGRRADAQRIAKKYVNTVVRNFKDTGKMWEKYNGQTGGLDTLDEYPKPEMLGWTAGVFLYACELIDVLIAWRVNRGRG